MSALSRSRPKRDKQRTVPKRPAADGYSAPVSDYLAIFGKNGPKLETGQLGKNVSRVSPVDALNASKSLSEWRLSVDFDRQEKRVKRNWPRDRERRKLRRVAQRLTKSAGAGKCGWCRVLNNSVEIARAPNGRVGFKGIATCGSVWECPECHYRIMNRRAEEIKTLVDKHRQAGGTSWMLTLTVSHHTGDKLVPLRKHVAKCWQFMQSGKGWKTWKARLGIVGTIRVLEVNHGPNGWHPHIHVLVLHDGKVDTNAAVEFQRWVYDRWADRVTRPAKDGKKYGRPSRDHGVSFQPCSQESYLSKLGLVDELTRQQWKKPRGFAEAGYRNPWQVLRDIARHNRPEDIAVWVEYADGMRGARQLTWSAGLRERYALEPEQTDLELMAADQDELSETVYTIEPRVWDSVVRDDPDLQSDLLEAASVGDVGLILRRLDLAKGLPAVPF